MCPTLESDESFAIDSDMALPMASKKPMRSCSCDPGLDALQPRRRGGGHNTTARESGEIKRTVAFVPAELRARIRNTRGARTSILQGTYGAALGKHQHTGTTMRQPGE